MCVCAHVYVCHLLMLLVSQEATCRGEDVASLSGRFGPIKQQLEHLYIHLWWSELRPENTLWVHMWTHKHVSFPFHVLFELVGIVSIFFPAKHTAALLAVLST